MTTELNRGRAIGTTRTRDRQVALGPTARESTARESTARESAARQPTARVRPTALDGGHVSSASQLWASLPRELAMQFRPLANRIARDIIPEIQRAIPAYARPLEGKFGEILIGGVELAIRQCFQNVGNPHYARSEWTEWFRYTGRVEFLEGRSMDALQTAVRIGARVAWRHLSSAGRAEGISNEVLFRVADALFAYVDELSTVAIEGYTEAQARAGGALERRRRQLLKLVLAEPQASRQAIAELAAATDWKLPEKVAVIALEYNADQHRLPSPRLGPEVLVDLESSDPCLVVADPDELTWLAEELPGRRVVVGPVVPLGEAQSSLRCARQTLALIQRGVLPEAPVTWSRDHLSTLVLLSDEFLLAELGQRALAPFDGLTAKQRERLITTLRAWLECSGGINEIASYLDVHPQTVRYRMHQITELLGDRLTNPEERLALEIALRADQLLRATRAATDNPVPLPAPAGALPAQSTGHPELPTLPVRAAAGR